MLHMVKAITAILFDNHYSKLGILLTNKLLFNVFTRTTCFLYGLNFEGKSFLLRSIPKNTNSLKTRGSRTNIVLTNDIKTGKCHFKLCLILKKVWYSNETLTSVFFFSTLLLHLFLAHRIIFFALLNYTHVAYHTHQIYCDFINVHLVQLKSNVTESLSQFMVSNKL